MKSKILELKRKISSTKQKKGFTLIELIVVIAVLGILVLLAAPKFLGHAESAKLAQIKNDVEAHERQISSALIKNQDLSTITREVILPDGSKSDELSYYLRSGEDAWNSNLEELLRRSFNYEKEIIKIYDERGLLASYEPFTSGIKDERENLTAREEDLLDSNLKFDLFSIEDNSVKSKLVDSGIFLTDKDGEVIYVDGVSYKTDIE